MPVNLRFRATLLRVIAFLQAGTSDVGRPILYAVYGTDIAVRLMRIHAHPERDGPRGWLVVALDGRRPAYEYCRFADHKNLLCEAVAGRDPSESERPPVLPAEIEEGLKNAGYWRDDSGRALLKYEITPDSAVWGGASATILDPLIIVFGARASSKIEIVAPLAPARDEAAIQREMQRV
jgi:hypothetical protein